MLLTFFGLKATHLVGGIMYYECLGNDDYKVTLSVYRDCSPANTNNTGFDQNAAVAIYSNGNLIKTEFVSFPGAVTVPVILNNPCFITPPNACVERADYIFTTNLPPVAGGYDIVYQRCCRNPNAINVINPGSTGSTYKVHVPEASQAVCNTSPVFNQPPPITMCGGYPFTYDLSATDADGDSLYYEFSTPNNGGSNNNPVPNPPTPPPHVGLTWNTGYSANYQIDANPAFTIDPHTGYLTGTPTNNGYYTFCVVVKEYRNGVFLDEINRDFLVIVTSCQINTQAQILPQTTFCDGLTVNFDNNSINTSTYHWDFGETGITTDTSNVQQPVYTFSDTGKYTVSLIVNPGYFCADTTEAVFEVYNPINPYFPAQDGQCVFNNLFALQAKGDFNTKATFNWQLGALANPTTSANQNVNVTYSDTGHFPVQLTVSNHGCVETYEDTLHVFPVPVPEFHIVADTGCQPFSVTFFDSSFAWTPIDYLWNFGDGSTSTEAIPTHVYSLIGTYDVSLTITTDSGCIFTTTIQNPDMITVNPSPTADFWVAPPEVSILNPYIEYGDLSSEFFQEVFLGDGEYRTTRNFEYSYNDTGHFAVTQVVHNEFGCTDTLSKIVWVKPEYLVYVPNAFTPDGDGRNEIFMPHIQGVLDYNLEIYNRWGQLIFNTQDRLDGWDGTFKGEASPIGVYIWQITANTVDGIEAVENGTVSLVR